MVVKNNGKIYPMIRQCNMYNLNNFKNFITESQSKKLSQKMIIQPKNLLQTIHKLKQQNIMRT